MGDTIKKSEVVRKIKDIDCEFVRNGSDHEIWYSPVTKKQFPVPYHPKITMDTAIKIYKQSGVKRK